MVSTTIGIDTDDFLAALAEHDDPAVPTKAVASSLDCSDNGAKQRLSALESKGLVASKPIGGELVWWLTEDGCDRVGAAGNVSAAP